MTDSDQPDTITILGKPQSWLQFRTSHEFSLHIETIAAEHEITCIEAITEFCTVHGLEPKDIANKVNASLKDKLAEEYRKIGYLPKGPLALV